MSRETCRIQMPFSLSEQQRDSLHLLYGSLIGKEAQCLYDVFSTLSKKEQLYDLQDVQKIVHLSPTRFEYARKQLEQYNLLQTYRETIRAEYLFILQPPKEPQLFLQHDIYSRIFLEKEGSSQLDRMKLFFSKECLCTKTMVNISESLDVSILENWTSKKEEALDKTQIHIPSNTTYPFDFNVLFKGMERVIPQRLRTRQNLERIYDLARIFGIDEKNMRRYLSLSIDPQKTKIDFEGLRNKVIAAQNLSVHSQDPYTLSPIAYLQQKQNGMPVARADKLLLEKMMVDYRLPAEVINVLIDYALKATDQKFSRSFVEKVASSWARLKIDTKEKAMEQTISYKNTKVENVPEWYADTKQTEPDEELKARIARLQEKLGETNHGEN